MKSYMAASPPQIYPSSSTCPETQQDLPLSPQSNQSISSPLQMPVRFRWSLLFPSLQNRVISGCNAFWWFLMVMFMMFILRLSVLGTLFHNSADSLCQNMFRRWCCVDYCSALYSVLSYPLCCLTTYDSRGREFKVLKYSISSNPPSHSNQ